VRDEKNCQELKVLEKVARELQLKFHLNRSIFFCLKRVKITVTHSKFWLFKPSLRLLDPESGSGFQMRIRILDRGPNLMRIQPGTDPDPEHWDLEPTYIFLY
jgi:hypothetical protein